MLKYRDIAKKFHRKKVGDGNQTSFWFDSWSSLGCLFDLTGPRGCIDMGICLTAAVSSALQRCRRNHRMEIFNSIEAVMEVQRSNLMNAADYSVWKSSSDTYKSVFSTKNTWNLLHQEGTTVEWCKGLWFKHHTPKFAFFPWLTLHNRLSTGDRICFSGTQELARHVSSVTNLKLGIIYFSLALIRVLSGLS